MNKSTLLLFTSMAIPALAISQTPVNPPLAQAPGVAKPVLPGDPVPLPIAPSVPVPAVPPAPLPAIPPVLPPVVPPAPLPVVPTVPVPVVPPVPVPMPPVITPMPPVITPMPPVIAPVTPVLAPMQRVPVPLEEKAKPGEVVPVTPPMPEPNERGQGKGKGRPENKDKDDRKMPAPTESVRPLPIPDTKPAPDAAPPMPEDKMKRPPALPVDDAGKVTPPALPGSVIPAPAPAPAPEKRPGFPGTRPMPAPPAGTPAPEVTSPPMRTDDPKVGEPLVRPERPVPQLPPSKETAKVLEDQGKRDRQADAKQAEKIEDKDDAKRLLMTILGGAIGVGANDSRPNPPRPGVRPGDRPSDRPNDRQGDRGDDRFGDRFRQGYRPSFEEVGRTQQDRERNVGLMVQRFQGRAPQLPPPNSPRRDPRSLEFSQTQRHTQFYEGNRRVVRYSSLQEIPPVIVASQRLNRVQVIPLSQSAFNGRPQGAPQGQYYNEVPQSYTAEDAYAVSYGVDPDSAISTNDILFRQGSTDFADAYSYDLVIDVAEAMNAPALLQETFVIEGHASAEGDYGKNLLLSQERAERISRELVRYGVSAERLMPVGYGETEAAHPANAGDNERRLDRRVMVFRMR